MNKFFSVSMLVACVCMAYAEQPANIGDMLPTADTASVAAPTALAVNDLTGPVDVTTGDVTVPQPTVKKSVPAQEESIALPMPPLDAAGDLAAADTADLQTTEPLAPAQAGTVIPEPEKAQDVSIPALDTSKDLQTAEDTVIQASAPSMGAPAGQAPATPEAAVQPTSTPSAQIPAAAPAVPEVKPVDAGAIPAAVAAKKAETEALVNPQPTPGQEPAVTTDDSDITGDEAALLS